MVRITRSTRTHERERESRETMIDGRETDEPDRPRPKSLRATLGATYLPTFNQDNGATDSSGHLSMHAELRADCALRGRLAVSAN